MKNQDDIVVVGAVRTPFSPFGGTFKKMHSTELGAIVMKEVLKRTGITDKEIDELYYGMCIQSEAALEYNINARQAMLKAGFRPDLVSLTIDRACCSSLCGVGLGMRAIKAGEATSIMSVGAENMSNTPVVVNGHRWGTRLQPLTIVDHLFPIQYHGFGSIAKDAGEVALEWGVSREEQDRWAQRSHQKWWEAYEAGKWKDEVMPVEVSLGKGKTITVEYDESPRKETSLEEMAKLPTIYGSPTVTAGNAPGLDAGAAAVVFMTRARAEELGLEPLATIIGYDTSATTPREMATIPGIAISKLLKRAGMTVDELDLIEINEAFAAVPLVSTKVLANKDEARWRKLLEKTNVNGSAIAIGHPVGASGARILMTLIFELRRRGGGVGACGICGGLAQGDTVMVKVD